MCVCVYTLACDRRCVETGDAKGFTSHEDSLMQQAGGGEGGERAFRLVSHPDRQGSLDTPLCTVRWRLSRLRLGPARSDYGKYLPGQKSSKNRANCRLFLDIFSSAMINDPTLTFTSKLKTDAKYAKQQ